MRTLKESVCEAIKKNRLGTVELTVGQLVGRYYGKLNISKMTNKEFEMTDFDPDSLDKHFDGDYKNLLQKLSSFSVHLFIKLYVFFKSIIHIKCFSFFKAGSFRVRPILTNTNNFFFHSINVVNLNNASAAFI